MQKIIFKCIKTDKLLLLSKIVIKADAYKHCFTTILDIMFRYSITLLLSFLVFTAFYYENESSHSKWCEGFKVSLYNLLSAVFVAAFIPLPPQHHELSLFSIVLCAALSNILFYFFHRLLHTRKFYWLHKRHHAWTDLTLSVSVFDVNPVEFWLVNIIPFAIPLAALQLTEFHRHIFVAFAASSAVQSHALNTESPHRLHHKHYNVNYGFGFHFIDKLCGTFKE